METIELGNVRTLGTAMKEALRTLKTNIQYCGDDVRVILVTSSMPNEGKSTVTFNLARTLAESGKRVLLVDSDMRKSVLLPRLRAKRVQGKISGLSHYLSGMKKLDEVLYSTQVPGLHMIFAGPSVPNSTEILEKKYFEDMIAYGRQNYDYVLLDCAPVGLVIDAVLEAKQCDGAVLVIAQGEINSRLILGVKKQLEVSGVRILGAILNKMKMKKDHYHRYGGYYGKYYGKYYGGYGEYGGKKD